MHKSKNFQHYEFLREIKNHKISPNYFIFGMENYLKDKVISAITEKLTTKEVNDFDLVKLYGDNVSAVSVLEQLEMMPFMSKYRLIFLKNFGQMKTSDKDIIAEYTKNPMPTSILVLTSDKSDKRLSAYKIISENAISIECKQPYGSKDIIRWLNQELRKQHIFMDSEAVNLFANYIEPDYLIASNELEKMIIFTQNKGKITYDDVVECVGKSKTNSIFDLQNALGDRNLKKSLKVLENMISSNESPILIVSMLTNFFTQIWKIHALRKNNINDSEISSRYLPEIFFKYRENHLRYAKKYNIEGVMRVFSLLLQADTDLKSINIKKAIILETLIYNICKSG